MGLADPPTNAASSTWAILSAAFLAVFFASLWPILYVFPENVPEATAAFALGFCFTSWRGSTLRTSTPAPGPLIAVVALYVFIGVSSLPIDSREGARLLYFAAVCAPIFIGARYLQIETVPGGSFRTWLFAIPAASFALVGSFIPGQLNPIAAGNSAWMGVEATHQQGRFTVSKMVLVAIYIAVLVRINNLGPVISGGVALATVTLSGRGRRAQGHQRHALLRKIALSAFALIALGIGATRLLDERVEGTNGFRSRFETWVAVAEDASLFGYGPGATRSISEDFNLGHAHNFLFDALHIGGFTLLVPVTLTAIVAVRRIARDTPNLLPLCAGILAAHLWSGGILESPLLWLVFGLGLRPSRRDQHARKQRKKTTED